MSDQPFRLQGLCFQSSPQLQCQLLIHPNTLECQYVLQMSLPLWTLMPHVAGMPFQCFADVAGNPDTLQGSVRRLMTSITCPRMRGKTRLSTSSLDSMWQLQRILRPTAGEQYTPTVY